MATTAETLATMQASIDKLAAKADKPVPTAIATGAPNAMVGGYNTDSKPFSMHSFLNKGIGRGAWDTAKYELEVAKKFEATLKDSGNFFAGADAGGLWLPTNLNAFDDSIYGNSACEANMRFVKSALASAHYSSDPEEDAWLHRKGFIRKTVSAYQDTTGGTIVAPPTQGPVVELVRPEAAALAAGATPIPLPPSGRYVEPRITSAPTANAIPESGLAIASDLGTDQIIMTAKKIVGAVVITDEATNFTSGALDNFSRMELNRTLGLQLDAYAFYGIGGPNIPAGLTNAQYASQVTYIHTITSPAVPRGVSASNTSNAIYPEYGDIIESLIAEKSFGNDGEGGSWVMRPGAFASVAAYRGDAVTAGDKAGPKVDILRRFAEQMPTIWGQKRVTRSTNIRGTITKSGSPGAFTYATTGGSLQDVFYGIWKYMLIGTYGAVNFQDGYTNTQFLQGQKTIKATMYGDVAFRQPQAFAWYTGVLGSAGML